MIYGLFLPPDVLEKIYFKNAARVLGLTAPDTKPVGERSAGPATGDQKTPAGVIRIPRTEDFEVTGDGRNKAWSKANWEEIPQRTKDGLSYESRIKLMYSPTGLYVLFDAGDKKLSATIAEDFQNLWEEDVFEVFLWPDEKQPVYFEYEISPLGQELPILVPNLNGKFLGWRPWHYEGGRKTRKATSVTGGPKQPHAAITGWTAEVFIPYELLSPLANVPPEPGTAWRANFYRVDYDDGKTTRWTWAPVGPSFHEFQKFGKLIFD